MKNSIEGLPAVWIALSMGNTHWQWGYFEESHLIHHWKTQPTHLAVPASPLHWTDYCELSPALAWHQRCDRSSFPPLYIASVIDPPREPWLNYPATQVFTLLDIPMGGLYDTLGLDRALAVLGAGHHYGWPILVIDAGTALTFSGADSNQFEGGAIAPGLGLQLQILTERTSALPHIKIPPTLPPRWANNTSDAILGGVIHAILDSIITFQQQWEHQFPQSQVVLTGGDGKVLKQLLSQKYQLEQASPLEKISYDPHLIFKGMTQCLCVSKA